MMSKVKKALITAAVFIVVGISGSIVSGFYIVPQVAAEVYRVQREVRNATPVEREIFSTAEAVESLDISTLQGGNLDVAILPSSDGNLRVMVNEYYEKSIYVDVNYDSSSKTLVVSGERDMLNFLDAENLKGFFEQGYKTLIGTLVEEANRSSQIVIEVPTGVDIKFKGNDYSNLIIEDEAVLKDNLNFSCYYGYVDLPINNKLKNIDIKTYSYLNMDVREFINADKVRIDAERVSISSTEFSNDYIGIEKLPETVNIFGHDVSIKSYLPLGKNVKISSEYVDYGSNFDAYPIRLQLRGKLDTNFNYTNRGDRDSEKYIDTGDFEGILGDGEGADYNLIIDGYFNCYIENLTNLQIEEELR